MTRTTMTRPMTVRSRPPPELPASGDLPPLGASRWRGVFSAAAEETAEAKVFSTWVIRPMARAIAPAIWRRGIRGIGSPGEGGPDFFAPRDRQGPAQL